MGHFGRITTRADLPSKKALAALIKKAAALNDAGRQGAARTESAHRRRSTYRQILTSAFKTNRKAQAGVRCDAPEPPARIHRVDH